MEPVTDLSSQNVYVGYLHFSKAKLCKNHLTEIIPVMTFLTFAKIGA